MTIFAFYTLFSFLYISFVVTLIKTIFIEVKILFKMAIYMKYFTVNNNMLFYRIQGLEGNL